MAPRNARIFNSFYHLFPSFLIITIAHRCSIHINVCCCCCCFFSFVRVLLLLYIYIPYRIFRISLFPYCCCLLLGFSLSLSLLGPADNIMAIQRSFFSLFTLYFGLLHTQHSIRSFFICLFRFQYLMFALNVIHRSSHSIYRFSCICLAHFFPKYIQHSFIHVLRFRCWSLSMIIIFIGNVWILYAFWCRLTSTILQ